MAGISLISLDGDKAVPALVLGAAGLGAVWLVSRMRTDQAAQSAQAGQSSVASMLAIQQLAGASTKPLAQYSAPTATTATQSATLGAAAHAGGTA